MQSPKEPKNAPAGIGVRLIAYLIDNLIVAVIVFICMFSAWMESLLEADSIWNVEVLFDHTLYAVVAYIIRAIYFVITTYAMGATLGKKLLRIQVETEDGGKLTFLNVLFRETVGRFLSGIFYVGYLIALAGKEHLALHDMLCDTRVRYKNLAEVVRVKVIQTPNPYQPMQSGEGGGYVMPQQPKMQRQEPTPIYRENAAPVQQDMPVEDTAQTGNETATEDTTQNRIE